MFTNERLFTIQAFTITRVHCRLKIITGELVTLQKIQWTYLIDKIDYLYCFLILRELSIRIQKLFGIITNLSIVGTWNCRSMRKLMIKSSVKYNLYLDIIKNYSKLVAKNREKEENQWIWNYLMVWQKNLTPQLHYID